MGSRSVALTVAVAFGCAGAQTADDPAAARPSETRYAVSVTDEAAFAADLRVPAPDRSNALLLQPSFTYRSGAGWTVSSSLAGIAVSDGETHGQLRVREVWAGYSEGEFDFTLGRRLVRWGTGYAFTAAGVLDPPRVATDPSDRLGLNQGRDMAKVEWVHGAHDLTVAWSTAGLSGRPTGMYDTTAFRYNVLVKGFDTSVIVAHDRRGSDFAGTTFTRVFGDAFEAHGEVAWRDGAALLAGGKYTTRAGITAIAEFYTPPNTTYYRPAQMPAAVGRQHWTYAGVSKSRLRELPGWKEWNLGASLVMNLDDRSRVLIFDAGRRFGNRFYAYTRAQAPGGNRIRSQYGTIPYSGLVSAGLRFQL